MIRLNPTYDSAHPFNPWRLLGPAWDRNWVEKEPPTPAKTWMRSPAGRAATDIFYAAYAAAEEIYRKGGARDNSRQLRRDARNVFKAAVRAAAKEWRAKQQVKLNTPARLERLKASAGSNHEARTLVRSLRGLRSVPRLETSTDYQ